ncbi:MAG: helix-turn-helix domain-containing protein [Fermentimonas sp.]|nr:helix-turn-helix domain-containing protein [Fermentimonas sp.]
MANKLDPMDIKQILVLLKDGFSNRGIGAILGISRNTVNTYVKQFNSSGYSIGELLNFDESRLNELFTSKTTIDVSRHDDLMLYLEHINAARSHPGFTFQYHYNDYAANVINPYSYTQFMEHFHRKYMRVKGSKHIVKLSWVNILISLSIIVRLRLQRAICNCLQILCLSWMIKIIL